MVVVVVVVAPVSVVVAALVEVEAAALVFVVIAALVVGRALVAAPAIAVVTEIEVFLDTMDIAAPGGTSMVCPGFLASRFMLRITVTTRTEDITTDTTATTGDSG